MKRFIWLILILSVVLAAGIGGYRIGRQGFSPPSMTATAADRSKPTGPVIYYQEPDGGPAYSAKPKSTPDGRPYRAVHASEDAAFDDAPAEASHADARKISLLPQSNGASGHFQGAEEGPDGDGLHPRP